MPTKFFVALSFLTIIPVRMRREITEKTIAGASAYYPLVGALLGLIFIFIHMILTPSFPQNIVAVFIIMASFILTRGFHIDGFCDLSDGFWGGKTKTDALAIMSDSRIGAFGAASLFILFLLKVQLLTAILETQNAQVLVLMPLLSRWGMVLLARVSPAAKETGLGTILAKNVKRKEVFTAAILALSIGFLAVSFNILKYMAIVYLFTMICAYIYKKKFGGITGDVLGAQNEMGEVMVLIMFFLLSGSRGILTI